MKEKLLKVFKALYFIAFTITGVLAFGIIMNLLFFEQMNGVDHEDVDTLLTLVTFDKRIILSIGFIVATFLSAAPVVSNKIAKYVFRTISFSAAIICFLTPIFIPSDNDAVGMLLMGIFSIAYICTFSITIAFFDYVQRNSNPGSVFASSNSKNLKDKISDNYEDKENNSKELTSKEQNDESTIESIETDLHNNKEEQELSFDDVSDESESQTSEQHEINNNESPIKDNNEDSATVEEQLVLKEEQSNQNIEAQYPINEPLEEKNVGTSFREETTHVEEINITTSNSKPANKPIQLNNIPHRTAPKKQIAVEEYIRLFQSDLIMAELENKYVTPSKKKKNIIDFEIFKQGTIVSLEIQVGEVPPKTKAVVLGIKKDYTIDIGLIFQGKKKILSVSPNQLSID